MSYQPIENYGIIGDLHTVALVGMDGSIDFLCAPRFDSPSVFAALLDDDRGGRFSITPQLTDERRKQVYLPDTNVLLTHFLADQGVTEICDFMPIVELGHPHAVVRRVKTVRGVVRYRMVCAPRFDYARAEHRVEARQHEALFVSTATDGQAFRLRSSGPTRSPSSRCARTSRRGSYSRSCDLVEPRRVEPSTTSPTRSSKRSTSGADGSRHRSTEVVGARWSIAPPSP
jgi:GH15 family glucan-1,4-alpha-glucosidase